jgi:hypothetical protein
VRNYLFSNFILLLLHQFCCTHATIAVAPIKVKQSHYLPQRHWGERRKSYYSFLTLALDGGGGQRHAAAAIYPQETTPSTQWIGGWVDLTAGLDIEARGKIIYLCRTEPQSYTIGKLFIFKTCKKLLNNIWSKTFMATQISKIFSGYQFCQLVKSHCRFTEHLSLSSRLLTWLLESGSKVTSEAPMVGAEMALKCDF